MKTFAKIVKSAQPLTILGRSSILDIFYASEYASAGMLFSAVSSNSFFVFFIVSFKNESWINPPFINV